MNLPILTYIFNCWSEREFVWPVVKLKKKMKKNVQNICEWSYGTQNVVM